MKKNKSLDSESLRIDLKGNKSKEKIIIPNQTDRTTIESFEFLKKLGEGAYSSVYKVRRKHDGQLYALKKVKMKNLSSKQKQNSLNQVRILASIHHDHVVSYKQAFFQAQSLYIIMQYADSGDLYAEINQRKKLKDHFKQQEIWSILIQICSGLNSLHKLKIIHRDLKSANVFMNKNKQIKLGDMNVSKVGQLCLTQTGTPFYASPQIWKDIPYDYKSDIWSLGCVMYQAITFQPPFKGQDMEDLYNNIVKGQFQPIPASYSVNLRKIIESMLDLHPQRRPSTDFILQNITKIIPQTYQDHPIIKKVRVEFKRIKTGKKRQNMNQLMKTINFPSKKGKKNLIINDLSTVLPSPSYSKSHRTSNDHSLEKSPGVKKQELLKMKAKHQSLFIPTINMNLKQLQGKKKVHKGSNHISKAPREKHKKGATKQMQKQNRLILPVIQPKRSHLNHPNRIYR